jgi:hypothetical protein
MWVVCTECGVGSEVNDAAVAWRMTKGEIREEAIEHFDHTQVRHLGLCDGCRVGKPEVETAEVVVVPYTRGNVLREGRDIQGRLRRLEKEHPDWTRERCCTQAVEEHNSPYLESDEAFRAYLLDS